MVVFSTIGFLLIWYKSHHDGQRPAPPQNAPRFVDKGRWIIEMVEGMGAEYEIKHTFAEGQSRRCATYESQRFISLFGPVEHSSRIVQAAAGFTV